MASKSIEDTINDRALVSNIIVKELELLFILTEVDEDSKIEIPVIGAILTDLVLADINEKYIVALNTGTDKVTMAALLHVVKRVINHVGGEVKSTDIELLKYLQEHITQDLIELSLGHAAN